MKIGIKLWSTNIELFEEAKYLYNNKKIDYLEVYIVPGTYEKSAKKLKDLNIPIVLHTPHSSHGFNMGDKSLLKSNIDKFNEVKKFAKLLGNPEIIIHLEDGDLNSAIKCFNKLKYDNKLIENLPKIGLDNEKNIGYDPNIIKLFLNKKYKFCLDFSHAIAAAASLKRDYKSYIKDFLKLNPVMFHLCGGHVGNKIDEHLNLWEGDFDIKFLKKCISNKKVTLEIDKKTYDSLENDIINVKCLREI